MTKSEAYKAFKEELPYTIAHSQLSIDDDLVHFAFVDWVETSDGITEHQRANWSSPRLKPKEWIAILKQAVMIGREDLARTKDHYRP